MSTGRAVFRFSNIPNAQSFATKTAASSGAGVTLAGALKGVAVIVTASFDNPTANPVADRAKVKASLDQRVAIWNREDASHSLIYAGPLIWSTCILFYSGRILLTRHFRGEPVTGCMYGGAKQ